MPLIVVAFVLTAFVLAVRAIRDSRHTADPARPDRHCDWNEES